MIVADITDIFAVLERFDLAAAHGNYRNGELTRRKSHANAPTAFAVVNSGVIGVRKSPRVEAFLRDWQARFERRKGRGPDQPTFRDALWQSDLRLYILPLEYNLMQFHLLRTWNRYMAAPRVLHARSLHQGAPGSPDSSLGIEDVLTPAQMRRLRTLLRVDVSLGAVPLDEGRSAGFGLWTEFRAFAGRVRAPLAGI